MEKLESVQYSAARAVTGTWRGTSRSCRRWSRRLTLLYRIINNSTFVYTKDPILPLQQSHNSLRHQDVVGQIKTRTEKRKSNFYPHCLSEWNELDPEIRLAPSVAVLRRNSCNLRQTLVVYCPYSVTLCICKFIAYYSVTMATG